MDIIAGYISPIPCFDIKDEAEEDCFKLFIEAISNDIVNWNKMRDLLFNNQGITYADRKILEAKKIKEVESINGAKWVAGSNICLNLSKMKKIYPFYNPPNARGEDTFFSTCLKKEKVCRVPVYSFHDGFLKYNSIASGKYPEKLEAVKYSGKAVKSRFYKACLGWMRYKPLLIYIINRKNYTKIIDEISEKLDICIPQMCEKLKTDEFKQLKKELEYYDRYVVNHYEQFKKVNELWSHINSKKKTKKQEQKVDVSKLLKEDDSLIMNIEVDPVSAV